MTEHSYLGELDHVPGCSLLPEGSLHRLPVVVQPGVVLLPGCTLPLHVTHPSEISVLQTALSAPPPTSRLVLVIYWPVFGRRQPNMARVVGCTAEIKQLRIQPASGRERQPETYMAIAKGRQRVDVWLNDWDEHGYVPVRVLPEGNTQGVPRVWKLGYAAVHPAFVKPWDLHAMAHLATRLCRAVLPGAVADTAVAGRTPLDLSYTLTASLPIEGSIRQKLLECSSACDRLKHLIRVLRKLGQLSCVGCSTRVAEASHALAMTSEGAGSAFVNAHGHVHDLATLARLASPECVRYQGKAETQFSWFPGYAWTICNCSTCGTHLGWKFTCTRAGMEPSEFWGLRRDSLAAESESAQGSGTSSRRAQALAEGWASAHSDSFTSDSGSGSDSDSGTESEGSDDDDGGYAYDDEVVAGGVGYLEYGMAAVAAAAPGVSVQFARGEQQEGGEQAEQGRAGGIHADGMAREGRQERADLLMGSAVQLSGEHVQQDFDDQGEVASRGGDGDGHGVVESSTQL